MYKIKELPEDFVVIEESDVKLDKNGRYSYFLLRKKDYTTERAVQAIADYLHINRKQIGYAGNKDRKAITEQLISVLGRAREVKIKDIETKLMGYGDKPISLGDLKGNKFKIVVRNLSDSDVKKLKKNYDAMKTKKFCIVNYFDEQRFSKNNAEIGKLIIKDKFKEAIELILEGKGEFEKNVESYIKNNPTDFANALRKIPKKILLLYVHAFQSKIWNESAKKLGSSKTNINIPLVGFGSDLEGKTGKIISKVIEEEGVTQRDFIIRKIPELSSEGNYRDLFAKIRNMKLGKFEKDELNNGKKKLTLEFSLPKGSYATLVVKNLLN